MKCPKCQHEKWDNARLCNWCGHKLSRPSEPRPTEPSFKAKLEKIQRYLLKGLTEKILPQKDKIEGERKEVTVRFCCMEGFTPSVEKLGLEEAYSLMDRIYEILIHQVQDSEDTVNELTGDGIMALFGVPKVHKDDTVRAIKPASSIKHQSPVSAA